ncbi:MAG: M20 family metallopeptidase [Candidatus Obscuribacter sp.]|nr:amidohydrolase [Candidatus Melainabacteria bacterium]MDX1986314.1 M20 family metallopeptidase [Candidatus Obscuribacter sp.]
MAKSKESAATSAGTTSVGTAGTVDRHFLHQAKSLEGKLIEMRRHLHEYPELSFHEHKTAALMKEKLDSYGYKTKAGVGKTGVIGDLGKDGPVIAIRADMDGLPIDETNPNKYISKNKTVMHACGHDGHMACGLTAAQMLSETELPGRVRMVMQPAEEATDSDGKSGAWRMLEDNALDGVSAIIGLHADASLKAGQVGIISGPAMAACDGFKVTIKGKGGHGAYPETTVDPVVIGAQVVQAIQQIVSRRVSALEPAIITIGAFHSSSTRGNIISDYVELEGSFRSFSQTVREHIIAELDKACSIARALGGDYKIDYELGYPCTVNHPEITEVMRQAAIDLIGKENVIAVQPKTWSEDFSMFAEKVPGAFMFLGAEIENDTRSHHSPEFDLNESGLYLGSAILAETARRLMQHYKDKQ